MREDSQELAGRLFTRTGKGVISQKKHGGRVTFSGSNLDLRDRTRQTRTG